MADIGGRLPVWGVGGYKQALRGKKAHFFPLGVARTSVHDHIHCAGRELVVRLCLFLTRPRERERQCLTRPTERERESSRVEGKWYANVNCSHDTDRGGERECACVYCKNGECCKAREEEAWRALEAGCQPGV